ncbi:MAG: hypothetical protein HY840_08915 [Bacteroidetes bacterium]|nr:hypothetical protein [Bacteroidota bacterium]
MLLFGKGDINNPYARDEKMAIMDNGNVVIGGSMTSSAKLEVFGSISILNQAHDKNVSLLFGKEDGGSQYAKWGIQYVAPNALASGSMGGLNFWIPSGSQFGDNYLFLADNGNVGLGTANPSAKLDVAGDITTGKVSIGVPGDKLVGNYRLYVADGIITGRCRVADISTADWSDYVFAKDYALLPIYELERFVKKNKHLPDVPSASEVSKTGIDVAQMDALLLKKIEELTLYTIELQKQIDELKKK